MSKVIDGYRALDELRKRDGKRRRKRADVDFDEAAAYARDHVMILKDCGDGVHYQLYGASGWLLDIYPGNQRLYQPRRPPRAPYLRIDVEDEWTLMDVVKAAVSAERGK
jgi:hypothetical protein